MENNHSPKEYVNERLMWHKPQVQKLTIIVDTQKSPIVGLQSGVEFAGEG